MPLFSAYTNTIYRLSSQNIGALRVVIDVDGVNANYADQSSLTTSRFIIGVTTNAASTGDTLEITPFGEIGQVTGLSNGPVYLGAAGVLTNTLPTTGVLVNIGYIANANLLVVSIQPPIVL
jgi:hypothetical protein